MDIPSPGASKATPMEPRPLEDEVGEWHGRGDVEFRQSVESNHARVDWNVEHRTWMTPEDTDTLLQEVTILILASSKFG